MLCPHFPFFLDFVYFLNFLRANLHMKKIIVQRLAIEFVFCFENYFNVIGQGPKVTMMMK